MRNNSGTAWPVATAACFFVIFLSISDRLTAALPVFSKAEYVSLPLSRGKQDQLLLRVPADGRSATIALDTGSPITCVDESKSKLFDLISSSTPVSPPLGVVVNGIRHRIAILPSLEFGELQARDMPVVLINLSDLNQVLRARHDRTNDAILGLDMMRALGAVIDCGSGRLLMRKRPDEGQLGTMLKNAGWREIQMHLSEGHPVVNGFVRHTLTEFIVDTGSPVTVLDTQFCRSHHVALGGTAFELKAIHFQTNGAQIGKVDDLRIGRQTLGQTLIAVFDVSGLLRIDPGAANVPVGLLGSRTLERTSAFIDCLNLKLYLKPPENMNNWAF